MPWPSCAKPYVEAGLECKTGEAAHSMVQTTTLLLKMWPSFHHSCEYRIAQVLRGSHHQFRISLHRFRNRLSNYESLCCSGHPFAWGDALVRQLKCLPNVRASRKPSSTRAAWTGVEPAARTNSL